MSLDLIDADKNRAGIWYGVAAYTLWGFLPLYWKLLQVVPPIEILFHRIFWSFIFMIIIVAIKRDWKAILAVMANRKKLLLVFFSGVLISVNWYVYIYAVNTNQVIEASMGYFINPLVMVLLGVVVFKEKLSRWQLTALIFAAIGVLVITVQYGRVPWIALYLAGSFALYGLVKKIVAVDSITALTLETLVVMPVALFFILRLELSGTGSFVTAPLYLTLILVGIGAITAIPLLFYARGVEKTTFSMMGFLQYIAPTISLILGVFLFKEYFSISHLISFSFIWIGLAIYSLASVGLLKERVQIQAGK
ncbi:MAG: EamA family transporter RarD [Dethiobacteria bacterium]